MEVAGKIKMIGETATFGTGGFRKREVVVTTEEQYPQHIMVEFVQDKCDLLDKFEVGQQVKIGVNLRGREWINPEGEPKYFNSIQGWRIDAGTAVTPQPQDFEPAPADLNQQEDDLPF